MSSNNESASLRSALYLCVGAVAVGIVVARIVGAEVMLEPSRYAPPAEENLGQFGKNRLDTPTRGWPKERPDPTPMYGSNDRSRWATVRALVENHTYVVGQRKNFQAQQKPFDDKGIIFEPSYRSLDKVMNPQTGEFISSKPPLYPTIVAGEYWILYHWVGLRMDQDRWWVTGIILLTFHALPFALYLICLAQLLEKYGQGDFSKLATFTVGALATYFITFSPTLNSHTPAMYCILFSMYFSLRTSIMAISNGDLFLSGVLAGLAISLDLPSASFAGMLFLVLAYFHFRRTCMIFLPGLLLPLLALGFCNYCALGSLIPAYARFGSEWYDYPGSHWANLQKVARGEYVPGIDFAAEPKSIYAFHLLVGHHGWFSLTPFWLLSLFSMIRALPTVVSLLLKKTKPENSSRDDHRSFMSLYQAIVLLISMVVITFFIFKSNNYGGFTSGPRWLFWLTPLWLLATLPVLDRFGNSRSMRLITALLIMFSALSVYYPAWNPWRHPWILILCERMEWVNYEAILPK